MRRNFVWPLLFVLISFGFTPHITQGAFGVSPPFVHATHLTPGTEFVQTIFLVQNEPVQDLKIKADLIIDERIKNWFIVNNGEDIVIPKGTRQFPLVVKISVPKNAVLGIYRGELNVASAPAQEGQVSIALGATILLHVSVGNDIYEEYRVLLTKILDIREGENPQVLIRFENKGNVPEAFDYATFELYDQFDTVRLAYMQKRNGFPETKPFAGDDYVVEFPVNFYLGAGPYWGNTAFFKNEKVITSQKAIFNVLKTTPWNQFVWSLRVYWYYYVGVAALLLVTFVHTYRRRSRRT